MAGFRLTVTEISGRFREICVQPDEKIERIVDRLKSESRGMNQMKAKLLRGVDLPPLDSSASEAGLSDGCEVQLVMMAMDVVTCSCIGDSGRTYETLVSAEIPETVTSIENAAFAGCSSLTSVQIPESVTNIGREAFQGCSSLISVHIAKSVRNIKNGAFYRCSSLTSVEIPNSVLGIGSVAFGDCSSLTSVKIPGSVRSVGGDAFRGCSSLTSVQIQNSSARIGIDAFKGCSLLSEAPYPGCRISPEPKAKFRKLYA